MDSQSAEERFVEEVGEDPTVCGGCNGEVIEGSVEGVLTVGCPNCGWNVSEV